MAIVGDTYSFTQNNVDKSPDSSGVYELLDGSETIYFGRASASIRSRLKRHRAGDEGPCTQRATHYRREVTGSPNYRETQLLITYENAHGRLPRCNERIG